MSGGEPSSIKRCFSVRRSQACASVSGSSAAACSGRCYFIVWQGGGPMYRALIPQVAPPGALRMCVGQAADHHSAAKSDQAAGRIGHAYLFTGTRGTGKTTCAKIFAKAVNCLYPQRDGDPCGECEICRGHGGGQLSWMWSRSTPPPTPASTTSATLRDEAVYTPTNCQVQGLYHRRGPHALEQCLQRTARRLWRNRPRM